MKKGKVSKSLKSLLRLAQELDRAYVPTPEDYTETTWEDIVEKTYNDNPVYDDARDEVNKAASRKKASKKVSKKVLLAQAKMAYKLAELLFDKEELGEEKFTDQVVDLMSMHPRALRDTLKRLGQDEDIEDIPDVEEVRDIIEEESDLDVEETEGPEDIEEEQGVELGADEDEEEKESKKKRTQDEEDEDKEGQDEDEEEKEGQDEDEEEKESFSDFIDELVKDANKKDEKKRVQALAKLFSEINKKKKASKKEIKTLEGFWED